MITKEKLEKIRKERPLASLAGKDWARGAPSFRGREHPAAPGAGMGDVWATRGKHAMGLHHHRAVCVRCAGAGGGGAPVRAVRGGDGGGGQVKVGEVLRAKRSHVVSCDFHR